MPSGEHPLLIDVSEARAGLPRDLAPMRPRLAAAAFNSPDYLFELKWDGIRALASRDGGALRIVDRSGGDLLPLVPELRGIPLPEGTLLDGEIVVCDSRGRPSYELLAGRLGPKNARRGRGPVFVAFDLLYEDHRSLLSRPLEERRRRLTALGLGSRKLAVPEHLEEDGEPFFDVVEEYGLEGVVAKRRSGRYVPGARSGDWLKCHVTPRSDLLLGGLVEDDRRGAIRALCGALAEDSITFVGEAYVPPYLGRWLDEVTRDFAADASPFATPLPLRTGLRWLRPRLVAIIEHAGEWPQLRDARFRALRFDGRMDDCRTEEPVEIETRPARAGSERPRLVVLHSLPFGWSDTRG